MRLRRTAKDKNSPLGIVGLAWPCHLTSLRRNDLKVVPYAVVSIQTLLQIRHNPAAPWLGVAQGKPIM
jgi:hypothetical protein